MDQGTIIISTVLVVVCILPFVLVYLGKQKKKKKIIEKLSDIAKEKGCTITQHELSSPSTIVGMDENKKHLFFYKKHDDNEIFKDINLSVVASCKVNNGSLKGSTHTDRVQLRFIPKTKDATETVFDLYNVEYDMHLGDELIFAEKWTKLINEKI